MAILTIHDYEKTVTVEFEPPSDLYDVLQEAGIFVDLLCAGQGICGKCRRWKIKNRFYPQASNTLSFNIDPEQFASSEVNAAPKIEPTSHAYTPKKTTECLKEKIITLKATQKNFCSKQVKNDLVTKNWVKCKGELRRIICFSHFTPSESIFRDSNSIIFRDSNSIDLVEYTFTANTHTYKSYYPLPSSYINPKFPIPCTILYNPKDPLENGIYDIYGDELWTQIAPWTT